MIKWSVVCKSVQTSHSARMTTYRNKHKFTSEINKLYSTPPPKKNNKFFIKVYFFLTVTVFVILSSLILSFQIIMSVRPVFKFFCPLCFLLKFYIQFGLCLSFKSRTTLHLKGNFLHQTQHVLPFIRVGIIVPAKHRKRSRRF